MKKLNSIHIVLILVALLLAVAIVGFLLGRSSQQADEAAREVEQEAATEAEMRELTLYFAARDGIYLVAESRDVLECEDDGNCLRAAVEALVSGPVGSLVPVLPSRTTLLSASEEEGVATLNFDRSFINLHPGGSASELLTVYGLVDTLAVNFPHIRQLRILVEGEEIETIKGHVDLRSPVSADFRYTRLPEGAQALPVPPAETAASESEEKAHE